MQLLSLRALMSVIAVLALTGVLALLGVPGILALLIACVLAPPLVYSLAGTRIDRAESWLTTPKFPNRS